jgi:glycosyltransferase involved in cell wall biosynthesis
MPEAMGIPPILPIPRVITCHDVIPLVYPQQYLGKGLFGSIRRAVRLAKDLRRYRLAKRVIAISERSKSDIIRLLGVPTERIDVVPNGIDIARFDGREMNTSDSDNEKLASLGLGPRPFVVYVGYGDYRKNVPGMLTALAEARRSVDIDLVWAGKLPPAMVSTIRDLARREGVEASLRFLGFVPDEALPALYRAAVAHLFLSRLEGFGLTVAEAMASGCPVLVAKGSGADEVAGDAGIVVDPDDPLEAGRQIARLAQHPAAREASAALGRERARAFDRAHAARGYVASYLHALT